ncbi:MAG: GNAT family N-acetyltransferase [Proteobacteria bacterium]|nr:GNAT family N-acetyltransferase [Pseudomonadota bacterium]
MMDSLYRGMGGAWTPEQFERLLALFPQGQICVEDKGRVVASALTIIVDLRRLGDNHTYRDVVGSGGFPAHDAKGDYLYGIDLFVHEDYQGMRLGRRLYDARKELCEELNLRGILIGGRIPGYSEHAESVTPKEYISKVRVREISDPVLNFQLANDFHPRRVLKNYYPSDAESGGHAVLLEWNNIFYEPRTKIDWGRKTYARLGIVQWQMRPFNSVEDFLQQTEFFVDAVAGYKADILLFPELFNAPLLSRFNQENPAEAMRSLAGDSDGLRGELARMAVKYNINIITGSFPEYDGESLYNVSYLCRRDGTFDRQYKLHITPDEQQYWGLKGGDSLRVFDTDVGKVGILICYDVEFPELARHLAAQGMQILLVPYWTDTRNGYLRIRRCSQARAIENECYVAISGSVGNLPRVENMDIQYSQAAVFTPSDFAFPHDAVAAEATPNTEMTLIADVDLDLLKELREQGTVRNLQGRRDDLYEVLWKGPNKKE